MIIDILTLFKECIDSYLNSSIIKRAIESGKVTINVIDYREFAQNKSKRVDDYSYGGGAGMIIEVDPIVRALRSIPGYDKARKIITSPVGKKYDQKYAKELSKEEHIIIVCGHYEGIDDRIMSYLDEAISIGDYVLTGGELAGMAIADSVVRLLPDVISSDSIEEESFENSLLEYPQYTRPVEFEGYKVPNVLISGNHENIRKWRRFMSLKNTYHNRPDLLEKATLTKEDIKFLELIKNNIDLEIK